MDLFILKEYREVADASKKTFIILHSELADMCRILGLIRMRFPTLLQDFDREVPSIEVAVERRISRSNFDPRPHVTTPRQSWVDGHTPHLQIE